MNANCEVGPHPLHARETKPQGISLRLFVSLLDKKQRIEFNIINTSITRIRPNFAQLGKRVFGTSLIIVVEVKKNDFEIGWGQCLAELIAAQKINAQEINGDAALPVYGIVTDGVSWQFGKLAGDVFTENLTPFSLGDVPRLFGAIDAVFKAVQNGGTAPAPQ